MGATHVKEASRGNQSLCGLELRVRYARRRRREGGGRRRKEEEEEASRGLEIGL